jgi:hypothetical protein
MLYSIVSMKKIVLTSFIVFSTLISISFNSSTAYSWCCSSHGPPRTLNMTNAYYIRANEKYLKAQDFGAHENYGEAKKILDALVVDKDVPTSLAMEITSYRDYVIEKLSGKKVPFYYIRTRFAY